MPRALADIPRGIGAFILEPDAIERFVPDPF